MKMNKVYVPVVLFLSIFQPSEHKKSTQKIKKNAKVKVKLFPGIYFSGLIADADSLTFHGLMFPLRSKSNLSLVQNNNRKKPTINLLQISDLNWRHNYLPSKNGSF